MSEPNDPVDGTGAVNPLLQPDPRLRRPTFGEHGEPNPFADATPANSGASVTDDAGDRNVFSSPISHQAISYRPEYVAIYRHRGPFHAALAGVALLINLGSLTYFLPLPYSAGYWIFAPISLVLTLVAGWVASGEIDAIRNGATEREGLALNQRAMWFAWGAFAVSMGTLVTMMARVFGVFG